MAAEDTLILKRGLVLLALVGAIAVTVLVVMFRRTGTAEQPVENRPDNVGVVLCGTNAGFPASLPWIALYQLSDTLPSAPGWEVRYTATRVLANRGSARLPLPVLCEMLDEQRQSRNFQAKLADGRVVPDEGAAAQEVVIALKAVGEWRKHTAAVQAAGAEMRTLTEAVEKLTRSRNNVVRTRAQETLLGLGEK